MGLGENTGGPRKLTLGEQVDRRLQQSERAAKLRENAVVVSRDNPALAALLRSIAEAGEDGE